MTMLMHDLYFARSTLNLEFIMKFVFFLKGIVDLQLCSPSMWFLFNRFCSSSVATSILYAQYAESRFLKSYKWSDDF